MTALIFKDGVEINRIIAGDEQFMKAYCDENGYTYELHDESEPEPEPTEQDRLEAQVLYTAIMTDTLLEEE